MATCSDLGTEALALPHSPGLMDDGEDGFDVVLLEEGGTETGVDVSDEKTRDDLGRGGFTHCEVKFKEEDGRSG